MNLSMKLQENEWEQDIQEFPTLGQVTVPGTEPCKGWRDRFSPYCEGETVLCCCKKHRNSLYHPHETKGRVVNSQRVVFRNENRSSMVPVGSQWWEDDPIHEMRFQQVRDNLRQFNDTSQYNPRSKTGDSIQANTIQYNSMRFPPNII